MKPSLSTAIQALVAAAPSVLGFLRTEELLSDGVVHVTFSNITNADAVLTSTTNTITPPLIQPRIIKYAECKDAVTYWDYWWYGTGPIFVCGKGQRCTVAAGEGLTISYAASGEMNYAALLELAFRFRYDYVWMGRVVTDLKRSITWTGPSESRLWLKQWFAVSEATCRPCWSADPPKDASCGAWAKSKGWMPCSNGEACSEYSVSDAYGTCGAANHCQIGV